MIKIDRDNYPPDDKYKIGSEKGQQRWRCAENKVLNRFRSHPNEFLIGSYTFSPHPSYHIWKEELVRCQGKKCCYCEKPIHNGELEHFRPKKGYQQNKGLSMSYPGYYWLAYRWKNLLLSCGECNDSGRKGNLFPISGNRAVTHTSKLCQESCILINPYDEEPSAFISFIKDTPIPIDAGGRGRETIGILQLDDRYDLKEIRKDVFTMYAMSKKIAELPHPLGNITEEDIKEARLRIKKATNKKSRFSGMIKENIKHGLL